MSGNAFVRSPATGGVDPTQTSNGLDPIRPLLAALDRGRLLGQPVVGALRLFAIAWIVGAAYLLYEDSMVWPQIPGTAMAGGVLQSVLVAATMIGAALVFWHRSRTVRDLVHAPFVVIPTMSNLAKLAGETLAVLHVGIGVSGALWTWMTGASPLFLAGSALHGFLDRVILTPDFGSSPLWRGAWHLVASCVTAYALLILGYFLAEVQIVIVYIASHVRRLVSEEEVGASPRPSTPLPPRSEVLPEPPAAESAAQAPSFCTACGALLSRPGAPCPRCSPLR